MAKIEVANDPTRAIAPSPGDGLGRLLHLAHKASARILRMELEAFGLTPVQYAVLSELYAADGLSLNAIAERLHADPPTICGVVDCLVAAGYVERREDSADRRRVQLYATPKAREVAGELAAADARRVAAITRLMTADEVELLKDLLRRIVSAARERS